MWPQSKHIAKRLYPFPASLPLGSHLPIRNANLNLPKQVHNLFRRMLLPSSHKQLLLFQFYRFSTGTKSAGIPRSRNRISYGFLCDNSVAEWRD
jgi:hypothetical protein